MAQLAVQGFVESYFGAHSTISNARAAGRALATINSWRFDHGTNSLKRQHRSASFLALAISLAHQFLR